VKALRRYVLRDGHLGAALLAFVPVGLTMVEAGAGGLALVGAAVATSLAMVPDYDQRVSFVSHRGVTHTLAFAVLFGLALGAVAGTLAEAGGIAVSGSFAVLDYEVASLQAFGFLMGTFTMLSHLAADALTPSGVPLVWPLSDYRFSLGLVKADNAVANNGLLVAGLAGSLLWGRALLGI
jgi:inner membrane protein